MKGFGLIRRAIVIVTLCGFGLPQAEAIEIVGGANPVAHMSDGLVLKAQVGRPVRRPPSIVPPSIGLRSIVLRSIALRSIALPSTALRFIVLRSIVLRSIDLPCIVRSARSGAGASGLGRLGIGGLPAARSPPERRSASSPRRPPPPGPARRRSRVCAGITPTPAGGRASGTSARKAIAGRETGGFKRPSGPSRDGRSPNAHPERGQAFPSPSLSPAPSFRRKF